MRSPILAVLCLALLHCSRLRAKRNRDDQWHRTRRQFRRGAQCDGFTYSRSHRREAPGASNADGYFAFPDLQIGSYSLAVELAGFKAYRQHGIELTAGQIRSVGELRLSVGDVTESVTVESDIAFVSLASGEKSGVLTNSDLENTAIRGRDYLDMLRLQPGVVDESDGREAPGPDGIRNLYINGARENQKNITIDGVTSMDSGSNSTTHTAPTLGTIAEVKVLTSAYQAEYGRAVGGTIIVTTRGGGRQYHGSGFWSHRHEEFNANDFFNNQRGVQKSPYRFNLAGWNLGGPVWPKNRSNSRLFFFFSQEFTRQRVNYPLQQVRMPTAREREGDYTQTLDLNQRLVTVYDPATNTPLPGNLLPANRINKTGQALLNILPMPNYADPVASRAVQWNYLSQTSGAYPRRQDAVRMDWSPTEKWQGYFRYTQDIDEQHPPYSVWINGGLNFDLSPLTFRQPGRGMVLAATRPITPTWFSETRLGYSMNRLTSSPDLPDKISKSKLGLDLPQWRPALNPSGFIPNVTFGGLGTSPNMSMNTAMPYKNVNHIFSATQNFSKISGTHTVRTGVYVERTRKDQIQGTNTRGSMSFSDDANNHAHPLRLRQRADGHHDQLHRSDGNALWTVPVHEPGMVYPGQLESEPPADPGLRRALLSRRGTGGGPRADGSLCAGHVQSCQRPGADHVGTQCGERAGGRGPAPRQAVQHRLYRDLCTRPWRSLGRHGFGWNQRFPELALQGTCGAGGAARGLRVRALRRRAHCAARRCRHLLRPRAGQPDDEYGGQSTDLVLADPLLLHVPRSCGQRQ
jgi:hypothetical protein